ncbi:ABC transporter ATP-binding protein [Paraburkholderia sp. LEh10]|uniref:ABC transporter ATP-binding protein n=1 Tax=Paraburkholderia sp. LEh10 TaxID=2821353 RepID=UPI001AE5DC07|nr:ABC transporter ATP-binding protein [Paraburkholderia sp. LEh10]MBP0590442.1 ABC transporter ATP-binding protein [Paraburkholderia sp. LEh10]
MSDAAVLDGWQAPPTNDSCLLCIDGLNAFYGESHVLHGVSLEVRRGEVVTLLGRNGAGKTTTLRSIMGLVKRHGSVRVAGDETVRLSPEKIARLGVGYVPEERGIFSSLNVEENLLLPPVVKPGGMSVDEIYALFPNLFERRASQGTKLSGGEQQMLAIGRILRTGADLILLDEPTEGLAPVIIEQIGRALHILKKKGLTILLVEQNFAFARTVADRYYIFEEGHVVDSMTRDELDDPFNKEKLNSRLGV